MKKNIFVISAIFCLFNTNMSMAYAPNTPPLPIMPRVGLNGKVEYNAPKPTDINPVYSATENVKDNAENTPQDNNNSISYSDIDMKKIATEIKEDLKDENAENLEDLSELWQAAVAKNETIRFAILKLSNPDGDHNKKNVLKTILTPLTSVAPLIGLNSGNTAASGGAILGSGLLSSMLADDSVLNRQLSRVTDSDLIMLAQQIDTLQQKLVDLYYNYVSSLKTMNFTDKIVNNRYKYYKAAQNSSRETLMLADVFYRESIDMQYKARQDVLTNRVALEQFVGNAAIVDLDKKIKERLSKK